MNAGGEAAVFPFQTFVECHMKKLYVTGCDPEKFILDCAVMRIELTHHFLFDKEGKPRVVGRTELTPLEEEFIHRTACKMVRSLAQQELRSVKAEKKRGFAGATKDAIVKGLGLTWMQPEKVHVTAEDVTECEFVYIPVTCGQHAPCEGLCDGEPVEAPNSAERKQREA